MVGFSGGAAPIWNRVIEAADGRDRDQIGNPASWGPAPEAMKDSRLDHRHRRGDPSRVPPSPAKGIFMEPAFGGDVAGDQAGQGWRFSPARLSS